MLDTETKRRIDTARDILVGKLPDPKSQVEQITIALIYKFMDDMDARSEEFGGERTFFDGDFQKYGWARLMRGGLGGHEVLGLYSEAITRMPENPGIPPLFRDIFKNAYLPYRDPETLRAFLKVIDDFEYDHSERLGDAFEYLLSVLGSQGDAGQFRTPRHIIDFIVEVLDPKKTETVLDPACGTAGFLISAWKHILKANSTPDAIEEEAVEGNDKAALDSSRIPPARGDLLTPAERERLAANFKGYDISPDMVRLSLVNMYLHGFTDPHIYEYDTLTSQERWTEHADVILANPPFMSPKGGIKPHNRFSVQSKRSEVLFVDYMAEHLTPNGRAGIIVPEGVIFQSQGAYTQLRKMLVEDYLVAVVSLPAGVFNPYSGVKTSILLLDRSLAKTASTIAFFKITNDGFGLGAQRRPIDKNDLAQTRAEIAEYLRRLRTHESMEDLQTTLGLVVPKEKVATSGAYPLSGERYRVARPRSSSFPMIAVGAICELQRGLSYSSPEVGDEANGTPFYNLKSIKRRGVAQDNDFKYFTGDIKDWHYVSVGDVLVALTDLTPTSELIGSPKLITDTTRAAYSADLGRLVFKDSRILPQFLYHLLRSSHYRNYIVTHSHGANVKHLQADGFYDFQIPLPPLEVQREVVAEIEGHQKVITGARVVLENYRPHIPMHPDWPVVKLGDIFDITSSKRVFESEWKREGVPFYRAREIVKLSRDGFVENELFISGEMFEDYSRKHGAPRPGDMVVTGVGTLGVCFVVRDGDRFYFKDGNIIWLKKKTANSTDFVRWLFETDFVKRQIHQTAGATVGTFTIINAKGTEIPLPTIETQLAIVGDIEAERSLVNANRELIARFELKIQATLARLWGEDESRAADFAS